MALEGKVAIVTGCASGIGLATTKLFLTSGATVFGIDLNPLPSPSPLPASSKFHFYQVNLLKPNATDEAVAACIAQFGPKIDVLANVAGIMDTYQSADTLTDEMWERVMGVNATVPIKMMRAVLNEGGMKERKYGSIVNVSSKSGYTGACAGLAYTASKHALAGATKNVAWRFRNDGIRCNAVCPGGVPTNIIKSMGTVLDYDALEEMKPVHDLHMVQTGVSPPLVADHIAQSILFLASDASMSINGILLPVDKAWSTV